MASATVDSNAADIDLPLQLDSVPAIDLTLISHSELYSLSLCSSSAFDTLRCSDLVNPKIDRSVFNESAGSRKQTYSRLRLAPATSLNSPSALRRRGPVIRSTNFSSPLSYPDSDSEVVESQEIVGLLKKLFGAEDIIIDSNDDYTEVGKKIMPVQVDYSDGVPQIFCARPLEMKRKRGRLPMYENSDAYVGNKVMAQCGSDVIKITTEGNNMPENVEDRFDVFVYKDDVDLVENKDEVDLVENKDDGDHVENKDDVVQTGNKNDDDIVENKDGVDDLVLLENKDDVLLENRDNVLVENKDDVVHVVLKESTLETSTVVIGMTSEIVVQKNVDDRDKEILNRDGIVVDLMGLGFMEDPYAAELGKRTEGMSREEELLVFLSGLRGEWVSRRKKRKIVDASEFGNALPKGWRLMLACRKKGGGVWLFCRRYLSPNGRQFVSCKEISAYLLSFHGSQDANKMLSCNQHNFNVVENNMDVYPADRCDVTNTAVAVVTNEGREENDVSRFLSQAFAYMSGDYGVQVNTGAPVQLPVVQAGRSSNGDKGNFIFNHQDDLLHRQVSSHRRKKSKVSVTDGVIIKEGKFECQFCHKTFDERKRYNGHMGSHVRGQVKIPDESRPEDAKIVADIISIDHNQYRDPVVQAPTGTDNTVASIVTGKHGADESNFNLSHAWNTNPYANKLEFDDAIDVDTSETNEALGFKFDAALSHSENNRQPEILGHTNISNVAADGNETLCDKQETFSEGCSTLQLDKQRTKISEGSYSLPFDKRAGSSFISTEAADRICIEHERTSAGCSPLPLDIHSGSFRDSDGSEKCCNEQDGTSDGCSPNPLHNQTGSFDDMINGLFESKRETISGSVLHGSNENLESCDIDWDSTDFSHTIDDLGLGDDKILGNDPVLDFSGKSGVDNNNFDVGKMHSGFKDNSSCSNANLVKGKSISIGEGSQQKMVFERSNIISSCGEEIDNNKDVYGLFTASCLVMGEHDKVHIYGSKEHTMCAKFDDRAIMNTIEKDRGAKCHTEFPLGDLKARQQSKTFNTLFTSLSSVGGSMGVDRHADNVPSKVIHEHQIIDTQINNTTGMHFPFVSSNSVPTMPAAESEDKEKTQFGFRSFFPSSENRKQIAPEGNRVNRQSSVVVESKDRSHTRSCVMGSPHEAYNSNKMFPTQLNEHENKNPKSHGLCLAFDSQASSSANQLELYRTKNFGIHHSISQTYGVPHNLNNFGFGAVGNSMEGGGRSIGINMHDSSFRNKSTKFENNFDLSCPNRIWDGARVDETVNSSNKFMVDFVNSNTQPSQDVMTGNMWQSGDVNMLHHDVANARPPLVQSPNSFHTFDIISEKGHGGMYEVNQKYNTSGGFESLTLGRSEPTEYTFMTIQNSNSLSRESKGISYNMQSQPDFNASFWLGKDALMPSMTDDRNRVAASICVWCRNEYYEDATTPSAAASASIGSMCTTCSGISQQFNVL